MALTNNLKRQVDLPVWEWTRFAPVASAALSYLTTTSIAETLSANGEFGNMRYMYYQNLAAMYRYDTWTDNWQQLSSCPTTPTVVMDGKYKRQQGFFGRVLAAGASTITAPGLYTGALNGYKIRIISGTGAGQERTITSVAKPVIADYGTATGGAATFPSTLIDTNKTWTFNQWRGYQVRITFGTGQSLTRKILYNNATTLTVADLAWGLVQPENYTANFTTAPVSAASTYAIESSVYTVNSAWDTQPDTTSTFYVYSGAVWMVNASTAQFVLWKYDCAAGQWEQKASTSTLLHQTLATDVAIEPIGEYETAFLTGTATGSQTSSTLQDTNLAMATDRFKNWQLRITGGTGMGQTRTITTNNSNTFTVSPAWTTTPVAASSTYDVIEDNDKIYMVGNAGSAMLQYSVQSDLWAQGKILETGVARGGHAVVAGWEPIAISTLSRTTTTLTVTTVVNHPFKAGDTVTLAGETVQTSWNTSYTIATVPSTTTFTVTVANSGASAQTFTAQTATVLVDVNKNWTVNQWAGKWISLQDAGTLAQSTRVRKIASNTANTITYLASNQATTPTNGTTKYIIHDTAFGTEPGAGSTTSGAGTVSSATTSVITDSTKSWGVNQYAGKRVKFTGGTCGTSDLRVETAITANTATTFTISALGAAPDTSTTYSILQVPTAGAGNALEHAHSQTDSNPIQTNDKGKFMYFIKGGTSPQISKYDFTTEIFEMMNTYPFTEQWGTGATACYDDKDRIWLTNTTASSPQRTFYLDIATNMLYAGPQAPYTAGTAITGGRMEVITTADGLKYLYLMRQTGAEMWRTLIPW